MEWLFLVTVLFMCSLTHFKVGYLWMYNWEQTCHKWLEEFKKPYYAVTLYLHKACGGRNYLRRVRLVARGLYLSTE